MEDCVFTWVMLFVAMIFTAIKFLFKDCKETDSDKIEYDIDWVE